MGNKKQAAVTAAVSMLRICCTNLQISHSMRLLTQRYLEMEHETLMGLKTGVIEFTSQFGVVIVMSFKTGQILSKCCHQGKLHSVDDVNAEHFSAFDVPLPIFLFLVTSIP